ncbi:MAG: DUF2752 domain-containing protein [Clostridiales bacterium]|nr:DUF2752 domain-containing protein [Clostridiales bacterium]
MEQSSILNGIKRAVLVSIIGLGYAFFVQKTGYAIPCLFYKITGFYCPGCGVSRMCLALLKGNIKSAFYANQMIMICIPILLFIGIKSIIEIKKYGKIKKKQKDILLWCMVIGFVIFGVLRNLPEFSYLAPR